jgi:hypothetical protein
MKTLVNIHAQVHENYGAHNWDFATSTNPCPQHWKAKGGRMFTLRVDSDLFLYAEEQCVNAIKELLALQSNEYYRYTYIDHELIFHEPKSLDDNLFEEYFRIENEKVS